MYERAELDLRLTNHISDSVLMSCAKSCSCDTDTFNPVCIPELNLNIYSACLAGCTTLTETHCDFKNCDKRTANQMLVYHNCNCLQQNLEKILFDHQLSGYVQTAVTIYTQFSIHYRVIVGLVFQVNRQERSDSDRVAFISVF